MLLRYAVVFIIFISFIPYQNAQEGERKRPKIGLALSGGGAHGLAHIGVIQFMEEIGIEVDYITGTSIGAIVGGVYSMGYDADAMMEIVTRYSWNEIIGNKISLEEVSPLEKSDHDRFPASIRISENQFLLPMAIYQGHKLDLALKQLFSAANLVNDFSELPIPFRCYAVDLLQGGLVEMSSGNLVTSIRASMAIPAVFAPVLLDSMLLIDGGLLVNFPAMQVRDMGADIVIGSFVGSKKAELSDIESMVDVLKYSGFMTSLVNTEKQFEATDILVEPDVKQLPILNFEGYSSLIRRGYQAAKKQEAKFLKLKKELDKYFPDGPQKYPLKLPDKFFVEDVNIDRESNPFSSMIESAFGNLEEKSIGENDLLKATTQVYSTKNIESFTYSFSEGTLGQKLELDYTPLRESKIGLTLNHFSQTNTSLLASGELRNILFPLSKLLGVIRISDNPAFFGDFYQRVGDKRNYIFRLSGDAERMVDPIYLDGAVAREFISSYFKVSAGMMKELNPTTIAEIKYSFLSRQFKPKIIRREDLQEVMLDQHFLEASIGFNSIDKWAYPSSGHLLHAYGSIGLTGFQQVSYTNPEAKDRFSVPSNENVILLKGLVREYLKLNDSWTFILNGSIGVRPSSSLLNYFPVGGTDNYSTESLPFIGADQNEFRMGNYTYGRVSLRNRIGGRLYLSLIGNYLYGRSVNDRFLNPEEGTDGYFSHLGYGISLGIETVLGPVNIDFGSKDSFESTTFSVGVGYSFKD